MRMKEIDLSRMRIEKRPKCNDFCTHPDIKYDRQYLGLLLDGHWVVSRFHEVWFGMTSHCGYMIVQLGTHTPTGWRCEYKELYELPRTERR